MDFGIASVAGITMICYLAGMGMKASEKVKNEVIPVVCGCAGAALGVAGMFVMPDFPAQDVINAAAVGIASGLAATGINQAVKQLGRRRSIHLPQLRRVIRSRRKSRQEAAYWLLF